MRRLACFLFFAMASCGSEETPPPDDGPPEGYVRYRTPPVTLQPGESGLWAQWVANPFDEDMDVADVIGWQSEGGHHALMYSTSEAREIGYTRDWSDADQLSTRFVGGIGGEGAEAVRLPAGMVLRIPANSSLLIQTHYINTGDTELVAESYLDVKLVPASPDAVVAGLFSHTDVGVDLTPGTNTMTVECVLQDDIELVMFANHMHEYGTVVKTTNILEDGTEIVLKDDPAWEYEWALNPNFEYRTLESTVLLPAGSTLRTECEWQNTTTDEVSFPDEMCVFFGFSTNGNDIVCLSGQWME